MPDYNYTPIDIQNLTELEEINNDDYIIVSRGSVGNKSKYKIVKNYINNRIDQVSAGKKYIINDNDIRGDVFNDITNNRANGEYSHAEGQGTIANGQYLHVLGRYNKTDGDNYLFVIGNGTGDDIEKRSDAVIIDKQGNLQIAGIFRHGTEEGPQELSFINISDSERTSAEEMDKKVYYIIKDNNRISKIQKVNDVKENEIDNYNFFDTEAHKKITELSELIKPVAEGSEDEPKVGDDLATGHIICVYSAQEQE